MAIFEQSFTIDKSDPQQLKNNQVLYLDNLVLAPVTNHILQLMGTVYTGDTLTPINGATIIVYNPNNEAIATDESRNINSQDGSYLITFNGAYGQIYGVTAYLSGYDAVNQNIAFSSTAAVVLDFTLPVNSTQNTIYGRVTDTQGNPIAGANVVIWSEATTVSVRTGLDGNYIATADFQPGDQRVITVSKFGYAGQTVPVTFPTTNSLQQNFTLQLNPLMNYTTITGQVVGAGGSQIMGVSNAFVGLYQVTTTTQNETLVSTMLTDDYGFYAFANVPAGYTYVVRATRVDPQTGS